MANRQERVSGRDGKWGLTSINLPVSDSNPAVALGSYSITSTLVDGAGEYVRFKAALPSYFRALKSLKVFLVALVTDADGLAYNYSLYYGSKDEGTDWNAGLRGGGAIDQVTGATTQHKMIHIDLTSKFLAFAQPLYANDIIEVGILYNAAVGAAGASNFEVVGCELEFYRK